MSATLQVQTVNNLYKNEQIYKNKQTNKYWAPGIRLIIQVVMLRTFLWDSPPPPPPTMQASYFTPRFMMREKKWLKWKNLGTPPL